MNSTPSHGSCSSSCDHIYYQQQHSPKHTIPKLPYSSLPLNFLVAIKMFLKSCLPICSRASAPILVTSLFLTHTLAINLRWGNEDQHWGKKPLLGTRAESANLPATSTKASLEVTASPLSSAQVCKSILLLITHDKMEARQNIQTSLCQRLAITRGTKHGEVHARQYEHNTCSSRPVSEKRNPKPCPPWLS